MYAPYLHRRRVLAVVGCDVLDLGRVGKPFVERDLRAAAYEEPVVEAWMPENTSVGLGDHGKVVVLAGKGHGVWFQVDTDSVVLRSS